MNIYVGNLPKSATEEALRQSFETYGEVTQVKVIKDNFTGESRGFGFVEMPAKTEAVAAIAAMNGADYEGRKLIVNEARPRTERSARGGGRSRSW